MIFTFAGVDGFIVVDLPWDEGEVFRKHCKNYGLSFVPLIAQTTQEERLKQFGQITDSFAYCISLLGVTGILNNKYFIWRRLVSVLTKNCKTRLVFLYCVALNIAALSNMMSLLFLTIYVGVKTQISSDLPNFIAKVRKHINAPLAVGFGISTKEQFDSVAKLGEGVVVGSMLTKKIGESEIGTRADIAKEVASYFSAPVQATPEEERAPQTNETERSTLFDKIFMR